ncbi:UNKNOWN [Stylonychia lemnae]|uniref:YHYH domain-containing protein n=1 Tax=Stylonychia lemnae TaxID=5949 RepID=A0A078BAV7_STYLE|nr:UNKNOWN [Stylonychia lemnae]|eukprot:CDW91700.1 UNKNOWN [Stylonychia lemnae]
MNLLQLITLICIIFHIDQVIQQQSYGYNIASCLAFIDKFSNTCDPTLPPATDFDQMDFEEMQCSRPGLCPDLVTFNNCKWERILCVTCRQEGDDIFVRVQTNGMPDHCYAEGQFPPQPKVIDFEIKWNSNDDTKTLVTNVASQIEVDNKLCNNQTFFDNQIPASRGFQIYQGDGDLNYAIGVGLNGVLLYPPISNVTGFDPIYPRGNTQQIINRTVSIDRCLGTTFNESSTYHYHTVSYCSIQDTIPDALYPDSCKNIQQCRIAPLDYHINQFVPQIRKKYPIGIAKDGNIIYGPYDASGQLWDQSTLDVCNGIFVDKQYAYVATPNFPYLVGCWGPGSVKKVSPQCTRNYKSSTIYLKLLSSELILLIMAIFLIY